VCRLCVAFQRINGFEAVYAAGALCGVTEQYREKGIPFDLAPNCQIIITSALAITPMITSAGKTMFDSPSCNFNNVPDMITLL